MRVVQSAAQQVNILESNNLKRYGEDAVTEAGQAFYGGSGQAAVSAENSMVQLHNPSGSGKILLVDTTIISSDTTGECVLQHHNTELTTNVSSVVNRLVDGAAPSGNVRRQSNAGVLGSLVMTFNIPANEQVILNFKYPVIIPAGKGILWGHKTTNTILRADFLWRELDA